MAAPARLERTAYRLGGGRSIHLSYGAFESVTGYWLQVQRTEPVAVYGLPPATNSRQVRTSAD